tara:strand:+ start:9069 stop:10655 length:1587 start_codon:yes stop_codon:yes gene_type:complete
MAKQQGPPSPPLGGIFRKISSSLGKLVKGSRANDLANNGLLGLSKRKLAIASVQLKISHELLQSFQDVEKIQKESLSIGMSYNKILAKNSTQINNLSGKLLGFGETIEVAMAFLSAGLDTNSKNMFKLGARTKATGGNVKSLASDIVKGTKGGMLNREQMDHLALTIGLLSQRFKISTNDIASSMAGLSGRMAEFGAIGIGAEMAEAAATLAAELGPTLRDMGVKSLDFITQGNSIVHAQILGVSEMRRAALAGGDANKLVLKAAERASAKLDSFIGGSDEPTFMAAKFTELFGQGVADLAALHKAVELRAGGQISEYTKKLNMEAKMNSDFIKSFSVFKGRVLAPFMDFLSTTFAKLQEHFGSDLLVKIGTGLVAVAGTMGVLIALVKSLGFIGGLFGLGAAGATAAGATAATATVVTGGAAATGLGGAALAGLGVIAAIAAIGGIVVLIKKLTDDNKGVSKDSVNATLVSKIHTHKLEMLIRNSDRNVDLLTDMKDLLREIQDLSIGAMDQRRDMIAKLKPALVQR